MEFDMVREGQGRKLIAMVIYIGASYGILTLLLPPPPLSISLSPPKN
jgi:hypothetical protein